LIATLTVLIAEIDFLVKKMRGEGTGLQSNGRQGDVSYAGFGKCGNRNLKSLWIEAKTFGKQVSRSYLCRPLKRLCYWETALAVEAEKSLLPR
jgi:hypothetical protein